MARPSEGTENDIISKDEVRGAINALINKCKELKKSAEEMEGTKHKYQSRFNQLIKSDYQLEREAAMLREETVFLEERIKSETELFEKQKLEERNDRERMMERSQQEMDHFHDKLSEISFKFPHAQIEYCPENLTRDIEEYRKESKKVREEFEILSKDLEAVKNKYGLNDMEPDVKSETLTGLATWKSILQDDASLVRATRSADNISQEIQSKIRLTKWSINNLQRKKL